MKDDLDFPFEFAVPEFGAEQTVQDGTVLFLSELLVSTDNTVVLKNFVPGDLVHLVSSERIMDSGVIDMHNIPSGSADLEGFHFYHFSDDVRVYAEVALTIQMIE